MHCCLFHQDACEKSNTYFKNIFNCSLRHKQFQDSRPSLTCTVSPLLNETTGFWIKKVATARPVQMSPKRKKIGKILLCIVWKVCLGRSCNIVTPVATDRKLPSQLHVDLVQVTWANTASSVYHSTNNEWYKQLESSLFPNHFHHSTAPSVFLANDHSRFSAY